LIQEINLTKKIRKIKEREKIIVRREKQKKRMGLCAGKAVLSKYW